MRNSIFLNPLVTNLFFIWNSRKWRGLDYQQGKLPTVIFNRNFRLIQAKLLSWIKKKFLFLFTGGILLRWQSGPASDRTCIFLLVFVFRIVSRWSFCLFTFYILFATNLVGSLIIRFCISKLRAARKTYMSFSNQGVKGVRIQENVRGSALFPNHKKRYFRLIEDLYKCEPICGPGVKTFWIINFCF